MNELCLSMCRSIYVPHDTNQSTFLNDINQGLQYLNQTTLNSTGLSIHHNDSYNCHDLCTPFLTSFLKLSPQSQETICTELLCSTHANKEDTINPLYRLEKKYIQQLQQSNIGGVISSKDLQDAQTKMDESCPAYCSWAVNQWLPKQVITS